MIPNVFIFEDDYKGITAVFSDVFRLRTYLRKYHSEPTLELRGQHMYITRDRQEVLFAPSRDERIKIMELDVPPCPYCKGTGLITIRNGMVEICTDCKGKGK